MISIESITLRGLLSFGWEPVTLALGDLNVLIGPNASGKSNLIEVLHLLQALPRDLPAAIRAGGGPHEWHHKGSNGGDRLAVVEIVLAAGPPHPALRYRLRLEAQDIKMTVFSEELQTRDPHPGDEPFIFLDAYENRSAIKSFIGRSPRSPMVAWARQGRRDSAQQDAVFGPYESRELDPWDHRQSILSQLRDPSRYPQLTHTTDLLQRIRIYQTWELGPHTPARKPQPADLPNHALEPDGSNLGLVLSRLRKHPQARTQLREHLRLVYAQADDVDIIVEGGTVQIFVLEEGLASPTPASRLSDGTLRWLSLLALLLDPNPPPLLCIEEPEVGLHPDMIPALGRLLADASTRTQLVITTHSDMLVSAFTDSPEAVVVCEKPGTATTFRRLAREPLEHWLQDYSLGHVWRTGELGGNRW